MIAGYYVILFIKLWTHSAIFCKSMSQYWTKASSPFTTEVIFFDHSTNCSIATNTKKWWGSNFNKRHYRADRYLVYLPLDTHTLIWSREPGIDRHWLFWPGSHFTFIKELFTISASLEISASCRPWWTVTEVEVLDVILAAIPSTLDKASKSI